MITTNKIIASSKQTKPIEEATDHGAACCVIVIILMSIVFLGFIMPVSLLLWKWVF